jgi:hypothetical protein
MKIKEISVNLSEKIGQPEFSSIMLSASVTTTVEEDIELKDAFKNAWAIVEEEIEEKKKDVKTTQEIKESVANAPSQEPVDPAWIGPASAAPVDSASVCKTCGKLMTFKSGVNKAGKPYKGYFCSEQGHPVNWVK